MDGTTRFRATFTDGETARLHEVEVRLAVYNLSIHQIPDGQLIATWPVTSLHVDRTMAPDVRLTSRTARDAALTISDPSFNQVFTQITTGRRHQEYARSTRLLIALAVVAAIGAAIWFSLTPVSGFVARKIPFAWEKKVSGEFKDAFVKDSCQSEELDQVLAKLKASVLGSTKLPVDFEIVVSKDQMVNAFALPGGVVILNRGLIKKAQSSDEVAGILAHEFQHVVRRHITAKLIRGAILTAIWSFTVGDFSGVLIVDPNTVYQVASLKFDRDSESEADRGAMAMLDKARISRQGFIDFFERLEKDGPNIPAILSTHPANEDRVAMLKTEGPAKTRPALSAADWAILQSACSTSDPLADDDGDDGDE